MDNSFSDFSSETAVGLLAGKDGEQINFRK